jgi:hypothetical protein
MTAWLVRGGGRGGPLRSAMPASASVVKSYIAPVGRRGLTSDMLSGTRCTRDFDLSLLFEAFTLY